MKNITKVIVFTLCILLCLSSCTFINKLKNEAAKVAEFSKDFVGLVKEPTVENAEELLHPSSPLTPEVVVEKIKNNDKLKDIDFSKDMDVTLGEISDVTLIRQDPDLGGAVYGAECSIIVNGQTIVVSLTMLSTSDGMGIYDFDIK